MNDVYIIICSGSLIISAKSLGGEM